MSPRIKQLQLGQVQGKSTGKKNVNAKQMLF